MRSSWKIVLTLMILSLALVFVLGKIPSMNQPILSEESIQHWKQVFDIRFVLFLVSSLFIVVGTVITIRRIDKEN